MNATVFSRTGRGGKGMENHRSVRPLAATLLGTALFLSALAFPVSAADKTVPGDFATAITRVADQAIPAVVHIEVTEKQEVANPMLPFQNDPFFRRFFGTPNMPKKFDREVKGLGSGMIIDSKGNILTNNHVAGGATKLEVQLSNGDRYPAKLVGADPKTDLAVIHIDAKEPLPYVTFADSDTVKVGEWVVAIGAPEGLDQTVTTGIISAKHRRGITEPTGYQDFFQTDAAINPGNSGGPLLNLRGEVIGVNAAIVSQSGGFEGIGFAIPSNMAVFVYKALLTQGKVERGWLGVSIQDLTPDLAKKHRLDSTKGCLIADVIKGGPADKAGLKKDDVIVAFQGKAVSDSGALRNDVAATPIGSDAKITVVRGGKRQDITVKIANLAEADKFLAMDIKDRLGAEVRALTPEEVKKYGIKTDAAVAIKWLQFKGPLQEAGFELNDLILGIDGQPVQGMDGFIQMVSALKPHQKITLAALDHRTGNQGEIQIETN